MLLASSIIVRNRLYFILFCKLACRSTRQLIAKGNVELSFCLQVHCKFTRVSTRGLTRENTFGSLILLLGGKICSKSFLIIFVSFLLLFELFRIILHLIGGNFMLKHD